jgi:hypothetical protein
MKFSGNARTHWTYTKGSGDDRETVHVHGYKQYIAQRFTAWGNFYKTAELDGAGENAYFGGTPGDGAMSIPLNQPIGSFLVAVRVMDYDWGKKDDLLGEVLIDLLNCCNRLARRCLSHSLARASPRKARSLSPPL